MSKAGFGMTAMDETLDIAYERKRIKPAEFQARIAHVQTRLHERGLKVGLAYATEHMPGVRRDIYRHAQAPERVRTHRVHDCHSTDFGPATHRKSV